MSSNKSTPAAFVLSALVLSLLSKAGKAVGSSIGFVVQAVDQARQDLKIATITSAAEYKAAAARFGPDVRSKVAAALHADGEGYGEGTAASYASVVLGLILADSSKYGPVSFGDWETAREEVQRVKLALGVSDGRGKSKTGRAKTGAVKIKGKASKGAVLLGIRTLLSSAALWAGTDAERVKTAQDLAKMISEAQKAAK